MKRKKAPTYKDLSSVLDCDPLTGELTWATQVGRTAKLGEEAGHLCVTSGYRFVKYLGKRYMSHRVVWLLSYGEWPTKEIDHMDGNKSNNAITNLRDVSHCDNTRNSKRQSNNTSGVSGIGWYPRYSKWRVRLSNKLVGYYEDFNEAVHARKQAERDSGYHTNHGRST